MKAVLLAAGYGTRLRPLTDRRAKPLLPVGGRPLIDYTFDKVAAVPGISGAVLVTNDRYARQFEEWAAGKPVELVNDGSRDEDERPGAVGDLRLALDRTGPDDDVLVLACDNLFSFSLAAMTAFFREAGTPMIAVSRLDDPERLTRTGVVELSEEGRVLSFTEKPERPRSDLAAAPIYVLPAAALPRVSEYLDGGGEPDAPGHFMEWLCGVTEVRAFMFTGPRLGLDTPASYEDLCARWAELEPLFTRRR